jgi:hypothetical protein
MEAIRIHRVGTITTGCTLIAAGVLFVIHTFLNIISYEMIFRLWPIILIGLGLEVLAANFSKERIVYDKAGVVLLFLVMFFAMGMACADICFEHAASGVFAWG